MSDDAWPSPEMVRSCLEVGICPLCGAGPFKVVAIHVSKGHDIDRFELRERGLLTKSARICDSEHTENIRQRLLASGQRPPVGLAPKGKGVRSLSTAGRLSQKERVARWEQRVGQEAVRQQRSNAGKARLAKIGREGYAELSRMARRRRKISPAEHESIKQRNANGESQYDIAASFDVSQALISLIVTGKVGPADWEDWA